MTRQVLRLAVLLALAAVVGCSGNKVTGELTLDGKPVDEALVTFVPVDSTGEQAFGVTDAGGKFPCGRPIRRVFPQVTTRSSLSRGRSPQLSRKRGRS